MLLGIFKLPFTEEVPFKILLTNHVQKIRSLKSDNVSDNDNDPVTCGETSQDERRVL